MLKYDMGNAGDIIKHGLLVEFIEWWGEMNPDQLMKIADTFAGCPWGNMPPQIQNRIRRLKKTRLGVIQSKNPDTYMGSSLLMFEAAKEKKMSVHIDVSDNDEDARCNWRNVTRNNQSIELICPRLDKEKDKNNGYNILDYKYAKKYDLILLDPYSKFLRDEYSSFKRNHKPKYFSQILDLVKNHENLFIAVFVLDMKSTNAVGKWYADFKENELRKFTFSLRCPKIQKNTGVKGESGFDAEILLIGKQIQIADKKCDGLRKRLIDFAKKVTNALPLPDGEKVEFWPPHE